MNVWKWYISNEDTGKGIEGLIKHHNLSSSFDGSSQWHPKHPVHQIIQNGSRFSPAQQSFQAALESSERQAAVFEPVFVFH